MSLLTRALSSTLGAAIATVGGLPSPAAPPPADAAPPPARTVFDELVRVIRETHAYVGLRDVDLDREAEAAGRRLSPDPSRAELIIEMQRFAASLGDGHAAVDAFTDVLPPGYLPVLLVRAEGGVAAVTPDRSRLLDPVRPYVLSIDGRPAQAWIEAVAPFVPAGSTALVEEQTLRLLRWIQFARDRLGAPRQDVVWLELADAGGADRIVMRLPLASRRPIYGEWPRQGSRMMDGGFGYLRLATMMLDEGDLADLRRTIEGFVEAPDLTGVIIDVRGNGGGARDAMRALLPCFVDPAAGGNPLVVNVARYRLRPGDAPDRPDGYLADRGLYPDTWHGWTDAERGAIEGFATRFEPEWSPPPDGFSGWHFCVVSRDRDHPDAPFLDCPVVVLIDGGCFSATDVFVGAFDLLPNVTLVGTPTAGGSARSRRHRLESIDATVRLGSMISLRPNGRLYDGRGIMPDIHVEPKPEFFITGGEDRQLKRAIAILEGARERD